MYNVRSNLDSNDGIRERTRRSVVKKKDVFRRRPSLDRIERRIITVRRGCVSKWKTTVIYVYKVCKHTQYRRSIFLWLRVRKYVANVDYLRRSSITVRGIVRAKTITRLRSRSYRRPSRTWFRANTSFPLKRFRNAAAIFSQLRSQKNTRKSPAKHRGYIYIIQRAYFTPWNYSRYYVIVNSI